MSGVFFEGIEGLTLGDSVSFNHDCFISAAGGLHVGDQVSIGHRTTILTTEHEFRDEGIPTWQQPVRYEPVHIGNDVWIGANVTILAGVHIPAGAVVGAGTIVTKSFETPGVVLCGNPARIFRTR
jgi:acetyltransferase-like isoleucine patch superfamily enzyme